MAVALAVAAALVALAAVLARPDEPGTTAAGAPPDAAAPVEAQALRHAEVACDLASKAERAAEAAAVGERARYAAAVLLLDQALIASGRAAHSDTRLAELDSALQAVHAAGHAGDHDAWQDGLVTANTECRTLLASG